MSTNPRPPARRGPSGAWGRLRTPTIDPLEVYGLPSKGETRLGDHKVQEQYFERIVARYMKFCASHSDGETLEAAFQSMHLSSAPTQPAATTAPTTSTKPIPQPPPPQELPTLLMAMRKLREALLSTHRRDAFARRAYTFIIRSSILCNHLESYHPSLLYLLRQIHPITPLSAPEIREFASYLILDTACRLNDLSTAFDLIKKYKVQDRKVTMVLKALVRGDWVQFWRVRRAVDGYQRVLMGWAEEGMRLHALKCLGRAYMRVERGYAERVADRQWDELVERDKVGWFLGDDGVVVIRKPKVK